MQQKEWYRLGSMRRRDHLISHVHLEHKSEIFVPSYEYTPINFKYLLSMEYQRIWQREKDEFVKGRFQKTDPKYIKNDYWNWIEKRKPKKKKVCEPVGLNNLKANKKKK